MYRTRRSTRGSTTPSVVSENGANSSDTSTVASSAQTSSLSSSGPATSAPVASTRRSTGRAAAATATNAGNATISTSTASSGTLSSSTLLVSSSSGGVEEDTTVRGQSIEDNNVVIANSTSQQTHQQQGNSGSRSSRTRRGSSSSTTLQLRRSERGAGASASSAAQVVLASPQAGQPKDNANQRTISEPSTTTTSSSNAIGMTTTASDGDNKAVATTAVTNNSSSNSETAGQEQIEKTFCADTNTTQVRNGNKSNKSIDSAAEDEVGSNTNLLVSPNIESVDDAALTNSTTTATAVSPATSTSLARSIAILEIEKSILKGDIFKAKEKTKEPEDELTSLPPIVLVDGSTGLPFGGSAGIAAAGDVKDTSGASDSSSVGSCEEESPKQSSTFYVTVTDEGSVYFNPSTPDAPVIEEGETFPVNLPTHKIKSPTNPLPGLAPVTTSGRSRKTKPQAVTYGGETHVGFLDPTGQAVIKDGNFVTMEIGQGIVSQFSGQSATKNRHASSSVLMTLSATPQQLIRPTDVSSSSTIVSLEVPATSIDVSEFESHLDPQSIAVLENVLQSDQGREILTEALGEMGVVPDSAGQEQQLYHSYTTGGKLGKDESVVSSSSVSVCSGVSTTDSPSSTTQMNTGFEESTMTPGYRGRLSGRLSSATASSPRGGKGSVTPVSRNISESDSANIRRSQRQQDRIERQEAERILAENQQMLQREKEIMAKALTVSSPSPVTPQPPVNVGIVSSTQTIVSTTPVTPHVVTPVPEVPRTTPVVDSTTRLSVSTVEKLDDSNVRRPIRNRKLPAHLADPNYLSLEDATTAVKEATRRLSTTQEAVQPAEEIIPPQEEASDGLEDETKEEIADDYTEDDPNRLWCICRQPHNNRFMICCDRCEDWFHGKCVNVTKSQGKAMEIKNIPWHCPDCKKNIAAEKKAEVQVVVPQKQVKQQQLQQQSVVPEKTGRGRKSETQTSPKLVSAKTAKAAAAVAAQKAEFEAAAVTALSAEPPSKIAAAAANKRGRRKSEKGEVEEPPLTTNCVICKKPARSGSIYCSDICVQKYAQTVGSKNSSSPSSQDKSPAPASPVTPSQASPLLDHSSPTSSSTVTKSPTVVVTTPSKLKRSHSKPEAGLGLDPIFNFHVINPGASVSTEVVPQKPKEITASTLLKAQKERNAAVGTTVSLVKSTSLQVVSNQPISLTPIPVVQGISPNSVSAIVNSSPTVVMKKVDTSDGANNKGMMMMMNASDTNCIEQEATFVSCVVESKEKHERHRSSSLSDSKSSKSSSSISSSSTATSRTRIDSTSKPKERERERRDSQKETRMDGPPSEKLHRENMRKSLKEILKNRIADMSSGNKKKMDTAGNSAEIVSAKIEGELVTCYGGANNTKCKNKYRSIYFNLKDEKNSLFQEILLGNIKAYDLVRMTPEQMAPSELAQWRQQEKEKELDAIKRAELDKLAEAKKQELLDKGVEDAVQVAEESKPLDISDIIDEDSEGKRLSGGDKDRTSSHHHHRHHDKKEQVRSREHDKSRDRDDKSDKSRGDKDKHRHDKERDREKDRKSDRHSSSSRHKPSGSSDKKSHHEKERESREKDKKDRDKDKERRSDRHKHREKDKERESSSKVKHASSKDSKNVSERRHERFKDIDKDKDRRHQSGKSQSPKMADSLGSEDSKCEELESMGQADVPVSSSNITTTLESGLMAKSSVVTTAVVAASAAVTTTDATSSVTVQESQISDNKSIVKDEARHSIDSEQELPSSTIKTPDFTEDSSNGVKREEADHVFQSTLIMPELGEFKASFYNVSHSEKLKGLCFPESPVPIVGRIGPQTVWDYIDKMKKTKEIITFRLTPASPADAKSYMSFFTYLSSRERLGVIGGISHPLKDVYLIPLDKHQPVPRCLLPFRGPGLPKERTHCLLAVVTRHLPSDGSLKRKLSTTDPAGGKKKAKGESMKPTRNKGGSKNAVLAIGKPSKALSPPKLETEAEKEDENEPYTPWDEDEKSEVVPDSAVPSSSSTSTPLLPAPSQLGSAVIIETQKQLEEIEAQIAKQKEDIVSILQGAAKNVVGIPGLDGDFPESLPEDNAAVESQNKQDVPVFLRPTPVLSSLDPRSTRSSIFKHQQPTTVHTTKVPATTIPGLDLEIRESCGDDDVVVIEQQEENSKSHHSLKPIPEVAVDAPKEVENSAEEAYSPSAMDFSDDDVVCDDDDLLSNTTRKIPDDEHVKDNKTGGRFMFGQSSDDSGVKEKIDAKNAESQSKEPLIVDLDERQTEEIKIILSKINTPVIPIAHHSSSEKHVGLLNKTLLDGTVDLVDDSEPPPPGESSAPSLPPLSASPLTKSSKVFDDSPFEKSPLLTNNQSRVKININLSTKMLPLSASKKEIDKNSASFAVDSSELSLDCPVETTMFKDIDERILAKEGLPPPIIPETIPLPPVDFKTVPPPVVINQPLTTLVPSVPLHIPPPSLQSSSGSVVINLNVPPPPFITIPPQLTGIRFPSTQAPSAQQVAAPTFLSRPPPSTPPRNQFSPIDTSSSSGRQSRTGPGPHSTLFKTMSSSPKEAEDRGMTEKDKDDRNYLARQDKGRGSYSQDRRRTHDRVERVKRNRSRSKSRDRSRSRSRSRSRDRKRRRRHSRSRSPVRRSSRRNRSRSRSRSPVL